MKNLLVVSLYLILNKNLYILFFIVLQIVSYAYTRGNQNTRFQVEIDVLPVQSIEVSRLAPFPNLNEIDLEIGWINADDIIHINVSSNVPWEILFFTSKQNIYQHTNVYYSNNFYLSIDNINYIPIDLEPQVLTSGNDPIQNKTFLVDARRQVNWNNISQGYWDMDVKFIIREKK